MRAFLHARLFSSYSNITHVPRRRSLDMTHGRRGHIHNSRYYMGDGGEKSLRVVRYMVNSYLKSNEKTIIIK